MSDIRLIAQFQNGNILQDYDIIGSHAINILKSIDSTLPRYNISHALQRPNDVHGALIVDHGWWTIAQVWAWDKRSAREIINDAREHDRPTYHSEPKDGIHGFSCGYGCKCGAFPLGVDYRQDLAIDRY